MRNLQQLNYFVFFLMWLMIVMMFTPSSCQAPAYICPASTLIYPCNCNNYYFNINDSIAINCHGKNLSDSQISTILDKVLFSQGLSRVFKISASNNQLTKIPDQISKFPYLTTVELQDNQITEILSNRGKSFISTKNLKTGDIVIIVLRGNQIKKVPAGVFDFSSVAGLRITVSLANNQIASISSDTFKFPSASDVGIDMYNNQISHIPPGAFNFPSAFSVKIYLDKNNIEFDHLPLRVFDFPSAQNVVIGLSNNRIGIVPSHAFIYPRASRVYLYLHLNYIEILRPCDFMFPYAQDVIISLNNNSIRGMFNGVFHFPEAGSVRLNLENNKISEIPPNTFVHGSYSLLNLQNNQLKRFDSVVFKSPLTTLMNGGNNPLRIEGNPIDCSSDPCHLAWLFQSTNSSRMLSYINQEKICSNDVGSRPFSALSSFPFSRNCSPCPN